MPEGPECQIIADWLRNKLIGRKIEAIEFVSGRAGHLTFKQVSSETPEIKPIRLEKVVNLGETLKTPNSLPVVAVYCKGKVGVVDMGQDGHFAYSLAMTGRWTKEKTKYARVGFHLDNGEVIYYEDIRQFGRIRYYATNPDRHFAKLGWDAFGITSPNGEAIKTRVAALKLNEKTVAQALLDQRLFCGIGNYLKSEILYFAKVNPWRICLGISELEWERIWHYAEHIIRLSLSYGGCSFRSFKHPDGTKGEFQNHLKVYGRAVAYGHQHLIVTSEIIGGRRTFYVPGLQT